MKTQIALYKTFNELLINKYIITLEPDISRTEYNFSVEYTTRQIVKVIYDNYTKSYIVYYSIVRLDSGSYDHQYIKLSPLLKGITLGHLKLTDNEKTK